jgi:hypothetical protein
MLNLLMPLLVLVCPDLPILDPAVCPIYSYPITPASAKSNYLYYYYHAC